MSQLSSSSSSRRQSRTFETSPVANSGHVLVSIGKDRHTVSLPHLPKPGETDRHLRQSRFNLFATELIRLERSYPTADLISVIHDCIPVPLYESFHSAQSIRDAVLNAPFSVEHLSYSGFLTRDGDQNSLILTDANIVNPLLRQANMSYAQLICTILPSDYTESSFKLSTFTFDFALKLPQHHRDASTSAISPATTTHVPTSNPLSPVRRRLNFNSSSTPPTLASSTTSASNPSATSTSSSSTSNTSTNNSPTNTNNNTSNNNNTTNTNTANNTNTNNNTSTNNTNNNNANNTNTAGVPLPPAATGPAPTTPASSKLSAFLAQSPSTSASVLTGYFGNLDFLSSQSSFDAVFPNPTILDPFPALPSDDPSEALSDFADQIYLREFLHACQLDYVGELNPQDARRALHDTVKKFQALSQYDAVTKAVLHPDALFEKFMELLPSLPDPCSKWNFVPSQAYFYALVEEEREQIEATADEEILVDVQLLDSRDKHIAALRRVRTFAVAAHRTIAFAQKRSRALLASMVESEKAKGGRIPKKIRSEPSQSFPFSQQSPAETVLQEHHGKPPPQAPAGMEIRTIDGIHYPHNPKLNFTSRFPIGFFGCFRCGTPGVLCNPRDSCPAFRTVSKELFFNELWTHKPGTKRRIPRPRPNTPGHYTPSTGSSVHNVTTNDRSINNEPAWMTDAKREKTSNLSPTFEPVHTASVDEEPIPPSNNDNDAPLHDFGDPCFMILSNAIYNLSLGARPAPIPTNNELPYVVWKLGSAPHDSSASIKVHTDSCASLNVGNELCHYWLMTKFPSVVESYTRFDDIQGWEKIRLTVATKNPEEGINTSLGHSGALTSIVRYHTPFTLRNGQPYILSIALGSDVAVNTILGLPDMHKDCLGSVIDINDMKFQCKGISQNFRLLGGRADTGLPANIAFSLSDFIRPQPPSATPLSSALITSVAPPPSADE